MKFSDLLNFKKDIFFDGAVQIDWFYQSDMSDIVSRNFMFHGKEYHGVSDNNILGKLTDTIQFVENISEKLKNGSNSNPFTVAIAGYGTGKSHLSVTLAELLSGPFFHSNTYNGIIENIRCIDQEKAEIINSNLKKPNLVLILNGMRDFNLHYELLRSAQKSLKLYGYSDEKLKKIDKTLEIANRFFNRNCLTSLNLFEKYAEYRGYDEKGEKLIDIIRRELGYEERAFNTVNDVYKDINGNEIRWDEGVSATSILNVLLKEYCGIDNQFENIVIIFDEFGRYLEYASDTTTAQSGDSALQQIFESVQNAAGKIQIINFIQSDIKSYLQRIEKTSNISRYIGRYDVSDKYYLSSNLETIFANLVNRKESVDFSNIVKLWINKKEILWQTIFRNLNKWMSVKGLWCEYKLFKKVIVEGIFPLHPLSTYMLSQLSDYLQNRSSLTLVSSYFDKFADLEINGIDSLPYVYPEELLAGDLYKEMLDAEEKGRQPTQHCIKFNNICRKFSDKLSDKSFKVLRANLVLRILKFKTSSYDDAINALSVCSGLTINEVKDELLVLDDQYAILSFDNNANCFDFLEDSKGAYDYNIFFKRLRSMTSFNNSVFNNSFIRELAELINVQTTNFSNIKYIRTNEWVFEQELLPLEDLSEKLINNYLDEWKSATLPEKVKGRLIWLYTNKNLDERYIERAKILSGKLINTPIVLMLLDDSEDKLKEVLVEYIVLNNISEADKMKYIRYYNDSVNKNEVYIRTIFYELKGERKVITPDGILKAEQRLSVYLTNIFSDIYNKAVPFDFGGFDLKNKGRAKESLAAIVKLLLSNNNLENSVKALPIYIRNNFDATLFNKSISSWRSVSNDFRIVVPGNIAVMNVYSEIIDELDNEGEISYKFIYDKLVKPPYGMNDFSILYLVSIIISNYINFLRLDYNSVTYKPEAWQDKIFIYKKSGQGISDLNNDVLKNTIIRKFNPDGVNAAFLNLFAKINNNTNVLLLDSLEEELENLVKAESIPPNLEAEYKLCKHYLLEGKKVFDAWNNKYDVIRNSYELFVTNLDVLAGLKAAEQLNSPKLFSMFIESNYCIPNNYVERIENILSQIKAKIEPELIPWIDKLRCNSVADINKFKGKMKGIREVLNNLGYLDEVEILERKVEQQTSNQEMLIEKQAVSLDTNNYLENYVVYDCTSYNTFKDIIEKGLSLKERIKKCRDYIDNPSELESKIDNVVLKCKHEVTVIDNLADNIYDELDSMSNLADVEKIITLIQTLYSKGMDIVDLVDYKNLEKELLLLKSTLNKMNDSTDNRETLIDIIKHAEEAFADSDYDSIRDVIVNNSNICLNQLSEYDRQWKKDYLDISLANYQEMTKWLHSTEILPDYLSSESIDLYKNKKTLVEQEMKKFAIDDIVFRFKKLDDTQKRKCLDILNGIC